MSGRHMTKREQENTRWMLNALEGAGVSTDDAHALRRISMTLHRWHELECGDGNGCIERDGKWAIERAAWGKQHRARWWDGSGWNVFSQRRTYEEKTDVACGPLPIDMAWCETGERPYWLNSNNGARYLIADRERGAKRRLDKIMARYPQLRAYIQGDPRGASLYILRPGDVPEGKDVNGYYSRGIAVHQ